MRGGGDFKRLYASRDEAAAALAFAPPALSRLAVDFDSNRAAVNRETGEYRVLHFATHGLLDDSHPELSGLVFSLVDEKGQPQDGFLRLHDIYNLRLKAELVVLSARETGLGREIKGEGLIGLTRGFIYAGAPRVVASLWKVDDDATAQLMKYFYQSIMRDHLPAAGALRAAQLKMMQQREWQSPYFWAAFTLQGEWR